MYLPKFATATQLRWEIYVYFIPVKWRDTWGRRVRVCVYLVSGAGARSPGIR